MEKEDLKDIIGMKKYFNELLKRLETNSDIDPVFVETDKSRYIKMRKLNSLKQVAGRTYKEILDRFDTKIKDPRRSATGKMNTKIIKEFLKINCDISEASKELNNFFKKYGLNIVVSKDYFPISGLKVKILKIKFLSSKCNQFRIYSSLIFSIDIQLKKITKILFLVEDMMNLLITLA